MDSVIFKRGIMFIAVGVVFLTGWYFVFANDADKITVCVNHAGLMFLKGEGFRKTECARGESMLSWDIQGIPGPQGEKGDKGDLGEKGEKGNSGADGEDGMNSTELHVFDANGQDLGIYVGEHTGDPTEQPITFNTVLNVFIKFSQANSNKKATFEPRNTTYLFEELNCEGGIYIHASTGKTLQNVFAADGNSGNPRTFPLVVVGKDSTSRTILSHSTGNPPPRCTNYVTPQVIDTLVATEFVLPFTEPLAWPLEVRPN